MGKKLEKLVDRLEMSHELARFMGTEDAERRLKGVLSGIVEGWVESDTTPVIPKFKKVKHYPRTAGQLDRNAMWRYRVGPYRGFQSARDIGSYVETFNRYHGLNGFQASTAKKVAEAMETSEQLAKAKVNFVEAALRFNHQRDIWYGMLPNEG